MLVGVSVWPASINKRASSYQPVSRVTGTNWISGTTSLFTQTVTLDAVGQRTMSTDSWGTPSYGYDPAGRLTSAGYPDGSSEADQYDAGGNRTLIISSTPLSGTSVCRIRFRSGSGALLMKQAEQ